MIKKNLIILAATIALQTWGPTNASAAISGDLELCELMCHIEYSCTHPIGAVQDSDLPLFEGSGAYEYILESTRCANERSRCLEECFLDHYEIDSLISPSTDHIDFDLLIEEERDE